MTKTTRRGAFLAMGLALLLAGAGAAAEAELGGPAPDFTLTDTSGHEVSLSNFDGKVRVLEWINPDCPFVQRHHEAGTMAKLAREYADDDVVWLAVNSTHYMDAEGSAKFASKHDLPYPVLVDASGAVGRLYDAKTTPHMFVIDADGTLVYAGAIDDDPRGGKGADATNHVEKALDQVLAGEKVATPETQPYGCSVKFAK